MGGSDAGTACSSDTGGSDAGTACGSDTGGSDAGTACGSDMGGSDAGTACSSDMGGTDAGTACGSDIGGSDAGIACGSDMGGSDASTACGSDTGGDIVVDGWCIVDFTKPGKLFTCCIPAITVPLCTVDADETSLESSKCFSATSGDSNLLCKTVKTLALHESPIDQ